MLIPNFKGFDFFPHGTRLPFMRFKAVCFWTSIVCMVLAVLCVAVRGFNYGVDFKGGTAVVMQSSTVGAPANVSELRTKLDGLGLGNVQIQSFGAQTADKPAEVLIRIELQPGGEQAQQEALAKVEGALAGTYKAIARDVVGPAVSGELRRTGVIAVLAAIVAIMLYVWFRFEWQFSVGVLLALLHDVLLTAGLFSLFQLEFDLSIVAALLTILGYSVNDTVVVADRIRENLRKYKRMPLAELLDLSINETLSRTILTGMTTIAVLIALYLFAGPVIHNFNLAMLFGIIVGTYSSIFISAPVLDYIGLTRDTPAAERKAAAASRT